MLSAQEEKSKDKHKHKDDDEDKDKDESKDGAGKAKAKTPDAAPATLATAAVKSEAPHHALSAAEVEDGRRWSARVVLFAGMHPRCAALLHRRGHLATVLVGLLTSCRCLTMTTRQHG